LGYSPQTKYLYAVVSATGSHGATLVRIGRGGIQTVLGKVSGLPTNKVWKGGDVDPSSGLYYVATGTSTLYSINTTSLVATEVTLPSTVTLGYDLVIEDGWLWSVTSKTISGFDLLSGATKSFAVPPSDSGDAVGSMWSSQRDPTLYLRWDHSRYVYSVSGLNSVSTSFVKVTRTSADGGAANDGATCTVVVAPSADVAAQLHIFGGSSLAWYPGLTQRINLQLQNTYSQPVVVPASDIRIALTDSSAECPAATNFLVSQGVPIAITVPGNSTTSLSGLSVPVVDWPKVSMIETHQNQDGCFSSELTFSYSFRYHS
jgi:hypothetical protein